jgi:Ca2+-binding EF-hand superfamily protein
VLGFDNDLKACSAALDMFKPKGMNEEYLKKHVAKLFAEMNARNELTKVFKLFDKKGAGRITKRSLRETVADLGEKMSDDAMSEMLLVADREKKGHVTLEDFIALMSESWMAR